MRDLGERLDHSPTVGDGPKRAVLNPARPDDVVGTVVEANAQQVASAVGLAVKAHPAWAARPVEERGEILRRAADFYEAYAVEERQTEVSAHGGEVEGMTFAESRGIGVRGGAQREIPPAA